MNTMQKPFRMTTITAALLSAFGVAVADDEMDALTKPQSSVSIGVGAWSNGRPQQGSYDGMRDGRTYGLFDADIVQRSESTGTWFKLKASNLGLENREIRLDLLRQGDMGGFLEYSKTPRDNPLNFNTGLQGIGSTSMTVSGAGASAYPRRNLELGTERDQLRAGFYKNLANGLDFKLEFKNEKKSGTRSFGFGSQPLFLVEPIDSTTRQLEATLNYRNETFQLSGGYYGSWYDNDHDLIWGRVNGAASPGTTASPNPVPLSQSHDNQAHQFFVDGGYNFSKTTRATFKLSHTRATQDESNPSWGLAAPNNRFINAPSSLNGRVDTTLVQLGLTSRPSKNLSLLANLRYYDVNDKTPIRGYVGNNVTGAATGFNTPHSFTTTTGKLEGTYRLPLQFSLTGGIDLSHQERSVPKVGTLFVPFRSTVNETTYRLQLRRSLHETVNGTLAYLHSTRKGSSYNVIGNPEDRINPLHIADRKRDKIRFMLDWTPLEQLSLQFSAENSQDKYHQSSSRPYGLNKGNAQLYSLDASYALSDKWQLSAWYSYDTTRTDELSYRQTPAADKRGKLKEVGNAFGANVRGKVTAKLSLSANVEWHDTSSRFDQEISNGGYIADTAGPLPNINNKLTRLKLNGTYALEKNSELMMDLVHERWRTDDWTWNFANGTPFIYGATTDGTSVTAKKNQSANFVGVRYIYKWQ